MCAKNTVTGKLGTFDSECNFGRYNNCYRTTESKSKNRKVDFYELINISSSEYEFINYGEC